MYKVTIEADAAADIKLMIATGGKARAHALKMTAFLQELKVNQSYLSDLLTRHFENDRFHVDKFVACWNEGLDIWRVKVFEFDFRNHKRPLPYRVLYGYDIQNLTFRILGILPRDFNYETDHELTKRIRRCYDVLGLPQHRVGTRSIRRN